MGFRHWWALTALLGYGNRRHVPRPRPVNPNASAASVLLPHVIGWALLVGVLILVFPEPANRFFGSLPWWIWTLGLGVALMLLAVMLGMGGKGGTRDE